MAVAGIVFGLMGQASVRADLPPTHYRGSRLVSGWLPWWMDNDGNGIGWKTVQANADKIDEVSFFSWTVDPATGDMKPPEKGMSPAIVDSQVDWLHSQDVAALYTVTLFVNVHETLNSPAILQHLTEQIVETARLRNFDGVDIDFEEFKEGDPGDPARYTEFLDGLAKAMHAELDMNGFPKVAIATVLSRTQRGKFRFTDEDAIANSDIDRIRVMAYDDYYPGSKKPGACAPLPWTLDVVKFIEDVKGPQSKFVLGIPGYAYRWPVTGDKDLATTAKGKSVTYPQSQALMKEHSVQRVWDQASQTPMFTYSAPPPADPAAPDISPPAQKWVAFYEDVESWAAKVDKAVLPSPVGGIAEWALGYEDPASWPMLSQRLKTRYPVFGPIGQFYTRLGGGAVLGEPLGPQTIDGSGLPGMPFGTGIRQAFKKGLITYRWGDWHASGAFE